MKESQHIAVVCNYNLKLDRIGGMDRFFWAYNKALIQKGYKVNWFFSGGEIFGPYKKLKIHLALEEGLEASVLKSKIEFDIVVTHFLALCTPFFKQLKHHIKPFIIAVDHNPRPLDGFPLKKRIRNKLKGQLYSKYIDLFVGVSDYTAISIVEDYGNFIKKKIKVIYNGIDTEVYSSKEQENHGKFIVASHLRKSKGLADLIEAVNLLPEDLLSTIQIDIYGEGPLENDLKKTVAQYNLETNIKFCGSSPNLPQLWKDYSFLLQPTYMECFSLSILESLAANVPVVTTPVGGNPEIIEPGINGFLFEPGDIAELSQILGKIVNGELKIDSRVDHNIKENFNLQKMVTEHINLLLCT